MKRTLVRYHGGKWRMAAKIIPNFGPHRVYVEPFGGGGSVLLRKPRCYAEVYNDLDGEIVNLFRVVRDRGEELQEKLRLTPFAREEFDLSKAKSGDDIEDARRFLVRSFMGFGSNGNNQDTGFRACSNRSGTTPAHDWANYPKAFGDVVARLSGVVIENRKAVDCMKQHDSPGTLHYVDPPYVKSSRSDDGDDYKFEMTDDDHRELADCLKSLKGMVILSGYPSELYDELYSGWNFLDFAAHADGAKPRVERLWFNVKAWESRPQQALFDTEAS